MKMNKGCVLVLLDVSEFSLKTNDKWTSILYFFKFERECVSIRNF